MQAGNLEFWLTVLPWLFGLLTVIAAFVIWAYLDERSLTRSRLKALEEGKASKEAMKETQRYIADVESRSVASNEHLRQEIHAMRSDMIDRMELLLRAVNHQ